MSSLGRKIEKNASQFREFNMLKVYGHMTPEQIQNAIQTALATQKRELTAKFNDDFTKLENEYNMHIRNNFANVKSIISVELLYELANQMGYWDLKCETEEDEYVKDSIRFRVREMFQNTMDKINEYADSKYEKMANKEFEKRKKKIQREFKIKF